jgi:hypothetical protein
MGWNRGGAGVGEKSGDPVIARDRVKPIFTTEARRHGEKLTRVEEKQSNRRRGKI